MAAVHYGNTSAVLQWIDSSPKKLANAQHVSHRIHATCTMSHSSGIIADVTLLMLACAASNAQLVAALIERGATVDLQDGDGSTALMGACRNGSADIVRMLLGAGAQASLRNSQGMTALHLATSTGSQTCIAAFKDDISAKARALQTERSVTQRRAAAEVVLRAALESDTLPVLEAAIAAHAEAAEVDGTRSAALADVHFRLNELKEERQKQADAQRKQQNAEKRRRQKDQKRLSRLDAGGLQLERDSAEATTVAASEGEEAKAEASLPQEQSSSCVGAKKNEGEVARADVLPPVPVSEPAAVASSASIEHGEDELECIVCLDQKPTHVFFPCGHLIVCGACAHMIAPDGRGDCPKCKSAGGVCKVFG
jgi:Skp family chaperone for outer membrane proteins